MKDKTDEEIIERFNCDVGIPVGIPARQRFHKELIDEFIRRGFDFSSIGNKDISISFANKIRLEGKKIVVEGK